LEDQNITKIQAVTALAHLPVFILYMMDLSDKYGCGLKEKLGLFENIRPFLINNPLIAYK
jgi:GTP1/Obg family GTP-binding protein